MPYIYLLGFLSSIESMQLLIAAATFFSACIGGGGSAYVGVKVAQAEIRTEQKAQRELLAQTRADVRRLENAIFFKQPEA